MEKEKKEILMSKYRLDEYEKNLIERDKGIQTIETYIRNCLFFFEWLEESSGEVMINELSIVDLRDYRSFLLTVKQSKASSINLAVNSLRSLISFYAHKNYIQSDIAEDFKTIKIKGNPAIKDIHDSYFKKFRRKVSRGPGANKLHIVLTEILRAGLRVSEITNLRISDIEMKERSSKMTVYGKNGSRTIPMHPELSDAMKNYLKLRNLIPSNSDYLLLSERKEKFHRSGLYRIVANISRSIGPIYDTSGNLVEVISPHMWRHHFCKTLLKNGVDAVTVCRLSGNTDINLLLNYYVHSDEKMTIDAMNKI